MRTMFILFGLVGVVVAGGGYYIKYLAVDPPTEFRTATVKRGDLVPIISATGTVEPEEVVDVGAQVAGKINSLGRDPGDKQKSIDYGSVVHEGTILAQIDDSVYKAQLDQADATLVRGRADLVQCEAKQEQSQQEWKRAEALRPSKAIADSDYDLAAANTKAADANVGVAKAVIKQNEAMLRLAKTNLDYTIIKSPVEGIIIDRRVNVGQTVVASLNAPSLFLIAKDLRRMQVWASVNEADIGRIHRGLPVRFTVDAFPNDTFLGKVYQIRLNATMTQNVVTYTVVVETDNSSGKLLPYLTANVQFEIERHVGVLMVPNAALRYKPRPEQIVADAREAATAQSGGKGGGKGKGAGDAAAGQSPGDSKAGESKGGESGKAAKQRDDRGRLWIREGNLVRPIDIKIGASDGTVTEVSGRDLQEDMEVVTAEVAAAAADAGETTNPFAPKLFNKGGAKAKKP